MEFKEPHRLPEANIVAEFYHQCKLAHIDCFLDYYVDNCRFDAVIIKNGQITFIVEVKSHARVYPLKKVTGTKQLQKYIRFHVPVLLIRNLNQVGPLVDRLTKLEGS